VTIEGYLRCALKPQFNVPIGLAVSKKA